MLACLHLEADAVCRVPRPEHGAERWQFWAKAVMPSRLRLSSALHLRCKPTFCSGFDVTGTCVQAKQVLTGLLAFAESGQHHLPGTAQPPLLALPLLACTTITGCWAGLEKHDGALRSVWLQVHPSYVRPRTWLPDVCGWGQPPPGSLQRGVPATAGACCRLQGDCGIVMCGRLGARGTASAELSGPGQHSKRVKL